MVNSNQKDKSKKKFGWYIFGLIILLIVFLTIYFNNNDKSNYTTGHNYYLVGDCTSALPYFDKVVNRPEYTQTKYYPLSNQEAYECNKLVAANELVKSGKLGDAVLAYDNFIKIEKQSNLIENAREIGLNLFEQTDLSQIISSETCQSLDSFVSSGLISEKVEPKFLFACGKLAFAQKDYPESFNNFYDFLMDYPNHLHADEIKTLILENPYSCQKFDVIEQLENQFSQAKMPFYYHTCGLNFLESKDYENAGIMFETFLNKYPTHSLSSEIESAWAKTIVEEAEENNAGALPPPNQSGVVVGENAVAIIQNDSPEKLRIVFSGPESRVVELAACATCQNYKTTGPEFCPERGPVGKYTLLPGSYNVVVQSISDGDVNPWRGNWDLTRGSEYYNCFFIVSN